MKRVVSVSLGSSTRDHRIETQIKGEDFIIERIGVDGDRKRLFRLIQELDGQVDAFGLGGIDRYLYVGKRRFTFREGELIARKATKTPIVDGSGLKDTLERVVVRTLLDHPDVMLHNKKVLMVCAADRFGMAEALVDGGCKMVFGDLIFGLGVPIPIHSLHTLEKVARVIAPIVTQLPIRFLYPTGERQESHSNRHSRFFDQVDVIAGDFHFIRRHMPERLDGKIILTNTTTPSDRQLLKEHGATALITTTPQWEGRTFGTNVMEAVLIAIDGNGQNQLTRERYLELLSHLTIEPSVEIFNKEKSDTTIC